MTQAIDRFSSPLLDIDGVRSGEFPPFGVYPDDRRDNQKKPGEQAPARILIVEDDWLVAMEIQAALQDAGYDVPDAVINAREALDAADEYQPDLILMDVRLPGEQDGVDAAIEIRRRYDVPCVFVTAHGDPATRSRAEAARPIGWLTKPLSGEAVAAAVKQLLSPKPS